MKQFQPMKIGYTLSSEEHPPMSLVTQAWLAEEIGFDFVTISDHFHPWTDRQGNSPFVWAVIGGIAATTERIKVMTAVTCPTTRIHPAIVAQAAATAASMLPDRFVFGVGAGENLNEHILGDPWPPGGVRRSMLEEAVEVIRALWSGQEVRHHGEHYTVENARLYTLPVAPPPIAVAASGPLSARLAGRIGDGLVVTAPRPDTLVAFDAAGGQGKPRYGQVTICWDRDEGRARQIAREWWPTAGLPGQLTSELARPIHFEQATRTVRVEDVVDTIACGPDPATHLAAIREFENAGIDNVFIHQVGPDQEGFLDFAAGKLLPALRRSGRSAAHAAR